eukprot:m.310667 g.310667  ORF g.310667 m.310667 type:complete len:322 (+) comp53626_c0_seq1:37-1002(+)
MYSRHNPITLSHGSVSFHSNNLSVAEWPIDRTIYYATVHKSSVQAAAVTSEGKITIKPITPVEKDSGNLGHITQARWCPVAGKLILAVTFTKAVQLYEASGSLMFSFSLPSVQKPETSFARGICAVDSSICVGSSFGSIYVFAISPEGSSVKMTETFEEHQKAIWDLSSSHDSLWASCDEEGIIIIWEHLQKLKVIEQLKGQGSCCSVAIWNDLVIGGYSTGCVRIFNLSSGTLKFEIAAHARWIHSIDVAMETGLLLTTSEDSFVRIWNLPRAASNQVQLMYQDSVTDIQLVGSKFIDSQGQMFAVAGYDLIDIVQYKQK